VRIYTFRPVASSPTTTTTDFTFHHLATLPPTHTRTVRSIAWHPAGKLLATASFDSTIGIWAEQEDDYDDDAEASDADDGVTRANEWECISTLEGHESEVKCISFSSDGQYLASCGRDRSVWIWEGDYSLFLFFAVCIFGIPKILTLLPRPQYCQITTLNVWRFSWTTLKTSRLSHGTLKKRFVILLAFFSPCPSG
jgi:WD40 repeat protein